jgi:hypothetical protein
MPHHWSFQSPRLADAVSGLNHKTASKDHTALRYRATARRHRLMDPTLSVMLSVGKTDSLSGKKEQREAY